MIELGPLTRGALPIAQVLPFKRREPVRSDLFHRAAIRVARSVFLRASEAGDKAVARSAWGRFTQLLNRRNAG